MTWNKGVKVGKRKPFTADEVKRIRAILKGRGDEALRDLTLFNVGLDTMLQAGNLLSLRVYDVMKDNDFRDVVEFKMWHTGHVVQCVLSAESKASITRMLAKDLLPATPNTFLFRGKGKISSPLTLRQFSRIVKTWAASIGLDPQGYGTESLRRTRAQHIMDRTGDLEALRKLMGHKKVVSTANYVEQLGGSDPLAVSRKHKL